MNRARRKCRDPAPGKARAPLRPFSCGCVSAGCSSGGPRRGGILARRGMCAFAEGQGHGYAEHAQTGDGGHPDQRGYLAYHPGKDEDQRQESEHAQRYGAQTTTASSSEACERLVAGICCSAMISPRDLQPLAMAGNPAILIFLVSLGAAFRLEDPSL